MRGKMATVVVLLPGVMLITAGCVATRSWVEKTLGQRTSEIDQRVSAVDTDSSSQFLWSRSDSFDRNFSLI